MNLPSNEAKEITITPASDPQLGWDMTPINIDQNQNPLSTPLVYDDGKEEHKEPKTPIETMKAAFKKVVPNHEITMHRMGSHSDGEAYSPPNKKHDGTPQSDPGNAIMSLQLSDKDSLPSNESNKSEPGLEIQRKLKVRVTESIMSHSEDLGAAQYDRNDKKLRLIQTPSVTLFYSFFNKYRQPSDNNDNNNNDDDGDLFWHVLISHGFCLREDLNKPKEVKQFQSKDILNDHTKKN